MIKSFPSHLKTGLACDFMRDKRKYFPADNHRFSFSLSLKHFADQLKQELRLLTTKKIDYLSLFSEECRLEDVIECFVFNIVNREKPKKKKNMKQQKEIK